MELRKKVIAFLKKNKGLIISSLIDSIYIYIDYKLEIKIDNLFTNSITCLSILFGFNMIVVTHYYTNIEFNVFLKKIGEFNNFKKKYKLMIMFLIISLIIIYSLSLFDNLKYCFFKQFNYTTLSNAIVIFLSVYNLFKSLDNVQEFFNVYGTTYSKTLENLNSNKSENDGK